MDMEACIHVRLGEACDCNEYDMCLNSSAHELDLSLTYPTQQGSPVFDIMDLAFALPFSQTRSVPSTTASQVSDVSIGASPERRPKRIKIMNADAVLVVPESPQPEQDYTPFSPLYSSDDDEEPEYCPTDHDDKHYQQCLCPWCLFQHYHEYLAEVLMVIPTDEHAEEPDIRTHVQLARLLGVTESLPLDEAAWCAFYQAKSCTLLYKALDQIDTQVRARVHEWFQMYQSDEQRHKMQQIQKSLCFHVTSGEFQLR